MPPLVFRLLNRFRRHGFKAFLADALLRGVDLLPPWLFHVESVIFFETDIMRFDVSLAAQAGIVITLADALISKYLAQDIARFAGIAMDELKRRFARGDLIFLAREKARIVGMYCIAFAPVEVTELSMHLVPGKGEACGYQSLVTPDRRGHEVWPAIAVAAAEHVRAMGIERQYGWIRSENRASRRAAEKVGRVPIRRVTAVWLLGRKTPLRFGVQQLAHPVLEPDERASPETRTA